MGVRALGLGLLVRARGLEDSAEGCRVMDWRLFLNLSATLAGNFEVNLFEMKLLERRFALLANMGYPAHK